MSDFHTYFVPCPPEWNRSPVGDGPTQTSARLLCTPPGSQQTILPIPASAASLPLLPASRSLGSSRAVRQRMNTTRDNKVDQMMKEASAYCWKVMNERRKQNISALVQVETVADLVACTLRARCAVLASAACPLAWRGVNSQYRKVGEG